ncbi:MAG: SGNH/GDSL hydrolase family protein [Thermodesulfobacteriota bacterium]|nr:SGNH/GDSL hydrolase family protein [Thermodesulfobacteriota bacterium]
MNKGHLMGLMAAPAGILAAAYAFVSYNAQRLPANTPEVFCRTKKRHTGKRSLVCVGDSLTHGKVGINYVDMLQASLGDMEVINAGINSELAWNVLQRIQPICQCNPDYITILIGTNDVEASLGIKESRKAIKEMDLPVMPSRDGFRESLTEICTLLKHRTQARIALLSLPPIGQEMDSIAFEKAADYSTIIREVASQMRFDYLPVNETMKDYVIKNAGNSPISFNGNRIFAMYKAIAGHFLFRRDWDDISRDNGLCLHTDMVHLNSIGARIIAGLVRDFVTGFCDGII